MKPEFPFKRPAWYRWREADFDEICASTWMIDGYYYRVCPKCKAECTATDETQIIGSSHFRTYICRNCHIKFRLVTDYEEEETPMPEMTPEITPNKPAVLSRMQEHVHEESYHDEPTPVEVAPKYRYLLK